MRSRFALAGVAIAALVATAAPAGAATIILNNIGGVTPGTQAYQGFTTAANFWASEISNPITIKLNVGFGHLGPNILGETSSTGAYVATQDVEQQIIATGTSSLDAIARNHLPTMTLGQDGLGAISMITPGYNSIASNGDGLGVNTATQVFDNNGTFNNEALFANTANLKALGFSLPSSTVDGQVIFSSDFNFDFNPRNGISGGALDFVGVAVHEIGHALGFTSGVDIYDLIGSPNGAFATGNTDVCGVPCEQYDSEADAFGTPLDLFRYGANPGNLGGPGPQLTWAPGQESYLSVDGGLTSLGGFSTGEFNGDGWQASHWKASASPPFCSGLVGIMNPYLCGGREGIVTATDFNAFDAIGYNFNFGDNVPTLTTGQISHQFAIAPVPEPAAWALMLLGFGLAGAAVRPRRVVLAA